MSEEENGATDDEELYAAFSGAYGELAREAMALRRQTERQANMLANMASRERAFRKLIEDQYQLVRSREGQSGSTSTSDEVLTIPVRQAMGLDAAADPAPLADASAVGDWLLSGAETDALQRPPAKVAGRGGSSGPTDDPYMNLRQPPAQTWRASPGLAAFSLPRGELRTLGFNLIGAPDDRLDHLAEEIAQSVALNRRFAPVIFTTTRAGLNSFRSRRLTYESLPVFNDTLARVSRIANPKQFYDLRVGYLIRKWRIQGVMNMGGGYVYEG